MISDTDQRRKQKEKSIILEKTFKPKLLNLWKWDRVWNVRELVRRFLKEFLGNQEKAGEETGFFSKRRVESKLNRDRNKYKATVLAFEKV